MQGEYEVFKSHHIHTVLFPNGIALVQKFGAIDGRNEPQGTATQALAHLGPIGLLVGLVVDAPEWQADTPKSKAPELPSVPVAQWFRSNVPSAIAHGHVPLDIRTAAWWPAVEWYRPIVLVPRRSVLSVRVKWTGATVLTTAPDSRCWNSEVNVWRTSTFRRRLTEWGYPLREGDA